MKPGLGMSFAAAAVGALLSGSAYAANPFKIDVIAPLSGGGAFLGKGEQAGLEALKPLLNKDGGVNGQNIEFVYHDDQSSPQTAVQLAHSVIGEKPAVFLGSSLVAMCNAMAPLLKSGPVDYCLSPGAHPPAGSYQFSSSVDTHALIEALVRYFRLRGFTKIAFMTSTDASGQDAENGFNAVLKMPGNSGITVVARQRFNPTDVSVSAQMERIRAAKPQALIAWTTGAPIATVFKGILQAGLNMPIGTTNGNQTFAQMKQYKSFLPKQLYIPTSVFPAHKGLYALDPRVEAEQTRFYKAMKAAKVPADNEPALVWDPANLIVAALRKLGPKASAKQVRDFIAGQTDFAGINGIYNFKKVPQRGLTAQNAVVTRWEPSKQNWIVVSQPTGALLKK
ncbi:MAG TPA: ABC transporter substrate-binding protein [Beijerinckiaceae bacterium]|nr:ABC transporter substrate-binding protein [Beijerinckiaceae bacterium]